MTTAPQCTFDADKHQYAIGGRVVPSVTQVLKEVLGENYWYANNWHLQRGRAIHACAAFIAKKTAFEHAPELDGYCEAIEKFLADTKIEVVGVEVSMWSATYQTAGTSDLFAIFNGKHTVIDYKHSLTDSVELQLGAYALMCQSFKPTHGFGVQIKDDGTYKMSKVWDLKRSKQEFIACRSVYGTKQRLGLLAKEDES